MEKKYLRPTDDFCMLKSWSAAKKEFARNGYYGKIVLGLTLLTRTEPLPKLFIGSKPPEQLRVIQWVCYAGILWHNIHSGFLSQRKLCALQGHPPALRNSRRHDFRL